MKLGNHLNAALNQIKNVLAEIIAGDPASPVTGQFWYNSSTNRLKYRNNSASVTPIIDTDAPGGDIGGTFANMQIAAGAIVNADINAAAAIGYGKLALTNSIVTGDVTNDAITNAKLADMATATFKGRTTAGTGDPEDLTVAQAKTLLNLTGTNSGDQTITLTGDVTGSGTGSFATAIAAGAIVNADVNASAAIAYSKLSLGSSIVNSDISASAAIVYGKLALTNSLVTGDLVDDAVTNAKLATMNASTFKGRQAGGAGDPEDLTVAQAKTLLNLSGTNTGDQTITLTGDVTGSGTGSFATAIAAGAIVDADVNASAAIALSKLAQNPLDRSLHTGTQASTTISDFSSAVTTLLNANAFTNILDPANAGGIATKNYVDNLVSGLGWHDSVRLVTTGTPAFVGNVTIDGVTTATGDRILVANGLASSGIWVASAGSWTRATDADSAADLRSAAVFVEEGTANAGTAWVMTTDGAITVGTTPLGWAKFSSGVQWSVGNGLFLLSNVVSVSADTGISVSGSGVAIDTTVVVRKYAVDCAANVNTTVTHNLNTRDVTVQVYDTATFEKVEVDVVMTSVNVVTVTFASAPAAGAYRIVVHG